MSKVKKSKVYVGMSGGVDSSASAALLKEAGYDVTGVFIKVWQPNFAKASLGTPDFAEASLGTPDFAEASPGKPSWINCTWKEDRLDAMRVCAKLEIPFVTLDLEKEYKKEVVDYMIEEYKTGHTPNPDVMCNRHVKFGAFFDWAMKQGADYVATGHYSEIQKLKFKSQNFNFKLRISKDREKDQSYFLWTLTERELSRTLFPVGHFEKSEVRKIAEKFGLPTANKKDSQGLCFIGKVDMKDFLKEFIKTEKGYVLDEKGEIIGTHDGAVFYTMGERHGFTIAKKSPDESPYYVIGKNIEKNELIVSHKNSEGGLLSARHEAEIKNVNWISGQEPDLGKEYSARSRYRQELQKCNLCKVGSRTFRVVFDKAQNSLTPGQSLVIYDGDICLGGGVISV